MQLLFPRATLIVLLSCSFLMWNTCLNCEYHCKCICNVGCPIQWLKCSVCVKLLALILQLLFLISTVMLNPLRLNDHYSGRTAPLTSKRFILYIYSTNRGTEYFKHGIYSQFFSLQNAVCFIILMYLVPVLFTFYIESVLKFKKK